MNRKISDALNVALATGLAWCFLSLILKRAPFPVYDYKGSFFSALFLGLWSLDVGFFLLKTLALALFGLLVALVTRAKEHAISFSFGFAVLPFAFFIFLPEGDYISSAAIALALIEAILVGAACTEVSVALSPSRAKLYMKTFWFSALFALLVGFLLCLLFASLADWTSARELFYFKIGCALFLLFLWIILKISYPARIDKLLSALIFSLFICSALALYVRGLWLAIAFAVLFFVGYALAIVWKKAKSWLSVLVIAVVIFVGVMSELWGILISKNCDAGALDRPNFVVVVSDALRYDAVEPYGGAVPTPNIEELASSSTVFECAYSVAPWTLPSVGSLFTGLYSAAIGVDSANHDLDEGFITLAEQLKKTGYFTCAIYDSPFILDSTGFARGFDIVIGIREMMKFHADDRLDLFRSRSLFSWQLARIAPYPDHTLGSTYLAMRALKKMKRPFLLWVHLLDPHQPYIPPKKFAGHIQDIDREFAWRGKGQKILRWTMQMASDCYESGECDDLIQRAHELYLGEVRLVDFAVGEIVNEMKKLGLWDDTVFVFTSDHGEEFGERFGFGHGRTLYEELLRVPLIVKFPDSKPKRIYTRVRTMDINPTILGLANISYDKAALDAQSLLPVIGGDETNDREVFAETNLKGDLKRALVYGDYKLVCYRKTAKCELFDLVSDPFERSPIISGERFESMCAKLLSVVDSCEKLYERVTSKKREYDKKPSPEAIERLKAMGYI